MSAFNKLRDASLGFEEQLQHVATQLITARKGESFEDGISNRLADLSLFISKMRLLRANPLSLNPQITQQENNEDTVLENYGETVVWQIIEQQVAKSVVQSDAVKKLLATPNRLLDPELVERKANIIKHLNEYCNQESTLLLLETGLKEKENEYYEVRERWHREVSEIRAMDADLNRQQEMDTTGPLYQKLKLFSSKLELMRWLISALCAPRTRGYSWLTDPHKRLDAIKAARAQCTVQALSED